MRRRSLLASAGAGAVALAAPRISRAQGPRVLKFVPQADVAVVDPIWTTAYVTRNHGYMVFDTLYGIDTEYRARPQMAAGHVVESDGREWRITLRDGLRFHDGTPVLARDCVASIQRWGKRDAFGQTLMAYTDEISAPDDRSIRFRLKKPFSLLADALGKAGSNMPAMMPERLAKTDAFTQVSEMVGSGPYRFKADERVPGNLVVYERFDGYRPREEPPAGWTAGGKVANFDRVEWHIIQDAGTAAAALQNGEIDWWENPSNDLLPVLRQAGAKVEITDPTGNMACMRLNHLTEPFNNPAIRRALLKAVSQEDFAIACAGDDPKMRTTPTGIFCPGTPMATDAGLDVFRGKRDYDGARREIEAAGYKGERVVLLAPTDFPLLKAEADVCADLFGRVGLNVDYQAMDWGTVVQRRAKQDPIGQGGWSVFNTFWAGLDQFSPASHFFLRGQGKAGGVPGWPTSPRIEALRDQWLDAPDVAEQKKLAEALQVQALVDVPYVPLGQVLTATAYRPNVTGVLPGFVTFWNVRKS